MSDASQGPGWWLASDGKWYPPQPSSPPTPPPGTGRPPLPRRAWSRFRGWPTWVQIVLVAFAVIVIIGAAVGGGEDEGDKVASTDSTAVKTTTTKAPKATTTTAATVPSSPQEVLRKAIDKSLSDGNRGKGVERLGAVNFTPGGDIEVHWAINEGFTDGLTKDRARRDAVEILEGVRKSGVTDYDTLTIIGTYALVDQLGNSSEDLAVRALYDKATVDAINFDGFDFKNAFEVAEGAMIHPAFRY